MSFFKLTKLCKVYDSGNTISEATKVYKFFKDDKDKTPVTISAMNDAEADTKIKKITGKDPKKVTKWSEDGTANECIVFEDAVTEETTTSDMDGGAGQPMMPFAFSRKVKKPKDPIYKNSTNEISMPSTDVLIKKQNDSIYVVEFLTPRGKDVARGQFYNKYPRLKKVNGSHIYDLKADVLDRFITFLGNNRLKYDLYTPTQLVSNSKQISKRI